MTVWYTAPTAIRMLMQAPAPRLAHNTISVSLRFIASVGEPLNPEAVVWGKEAFGLPIHDNWWQTETGGIMIANYAAAGHPARARWAGRCRASRRPSWQRARRRHASTVDDGARREGELALRPGWPSMFRGYLHEEERYRKCFAGGWYLTGDLARRDADGYFWFVGRADDVIKSAGPPDRPVRGRERADGAPGRRRGRRDRHARPGGRRGGQGVRRAQARLQPSDALRRELLGHRAQEAGRGGGAQGNRVPRPAANAQRQDHAPPAEGPRARPARGRHLHDGATA